MNKAISIKIFVGPHSIDEVFDDWKKVSDKMENKRYFHMPELYKAYLDDNEAVSNSIFFFVIYECNDPIAIIPLERFSYRLGIFHFSVLVPPRFMKLLMNYDLIFVKRDNLDNIFQIFLSELKENTTIQWDILVVGNVLSDSGANLALINVKKRSNNTSKCYYLTVDSYERIIGKTSGNFRRKLKRSKAKLSQSGPSSFVSTNKYPELEEAYSRFLLVEGSGWKRSAGTAIEQHEDLANFYRKIIKYFSILDSCEIHELKLRDQTIASAFTISCGNTCYLMKTGYNEEFRHLAPGLLLFDFLIKYYCDSRFINELNFISGDQYLEHWTPSNFDKSSYYIFNETYFGKLLSIFLDSYTSIKRNPYLRRKLGRNFKEKFEAACILSPKFKELVENIL